MTLQQIIEQWQARQERFRSFRYKWAETRTDVGAVLLPQNPPPEKETTYTGKCELLIDGTRGRYSYEGKTWRLSTDRPPRLWPRANTNVFDGRVQVNFNAAQSSEQYPQARFENARQFFHATTLEFRPLMVFHRPLDPDMGGFDANQLRLDGRSTTIRDRPCILVEQAPAGQSGIRWSLWVDTERDFTVRRIAMWFNGELSSQMDVLYAQHAAYGWVPSGWDFDSFRGGDLMSHVEAKITEATLNPTIEPSEFTIDLPANTLVTDLRSGKKERYILRADGTKRIVLPTESRASYGQLVASETGKAFLVEEKRSYWPLLLLVLAGAAVAAGVWVFRRRMSV